MKVPKRVKILKILLKTINVCLASGGLLAMAAGFFHLYTYTFIHYEFTLLISVKAFASILTVSGLVALVLGSLGIGIITDRSRVFGVIFTLLMIVLQFLSMMAGIGGIMAQDKILSLIQQSMRQELALYAKNGLKIDWLHQEYRCCGLNSAQDWQNGSALELWQRQNNITGLLFDVPDSCCIHVKATCGKRYMKEKHSIFTRGCLEPYSNYIRKIYLTLSKFFLLFTLIIYTLIYLLMIVIKYFKNSYTLIKRV